MVKSGLVLKEKNWTGLALVLLLPVCSAWGATPATPGPQAVSNESYTLTLIAKPDVTAICRGKQVTFTASLRCNDPDGAANSEKVIIDVVKGSGSSVTNNGSVSTPITGIEQGEGKIAVTAKSGEGKGKLSLSRTIDVISVVIESGATSCVHKANAQLKIDTDQSYSPDDGYGWFVAPEEGLDTSSILGLTFDYSPVSSEPGVYTVTAKSVTLPACQDTCTVHVVKVDLSVAGVDDDVEDVAPGGLVCVTNGPGQTTTRTALTINKCEPADWDGSVELLWTAGNIKVYNAATGGDEVMSGQTFTNATLPTNLWVEGTAPSAAAGDVVFRLNPVGLDCPQAAVGCDRSVMTVLSVDLDAMKVSHNAANGELPEDQETNPGAFVPINNDDDDYDASYTPDKDQSAAITGESDLLPIKLHKVAPAIAGSTYTLNIPSQVKIWKNADRSGSVNGTTEFDANADTTLYVEGFTVGSGNVKINWKDGSTTLDDCDEIKVTVFNWLGPLNVPDYSIHRYTASGALGSSQWTTPVNGTIKTGADSSDITVLWGGGPEIGKAVYQVNSDYIWDLEVNVVNVKIEAPSVGNAFTAGSPAYQGDKNFGVYGPVVFSGSPGVQWKAKITMSGPSANGVDQRGVTHIEVGFVQNLTFTTCRGDFTVSGVPQALTANIQGNSYHDIINGQPSGTVYYYTGGNYTFKPTGVSAAARTKDPLGGTDTPTAGVPLYYKKGIALNPPNDDTLDSMHWTGTFNLWITARTEDAVNGADVIYTCRGRGDWLFTVNEAYPMSNPLASTSVTVPIAWSAVTDGSTPALTAGQTANQALAGITYENKEIQ